MESGDFLSISFSLFPVPCSLSNNDKIPSPVPYVKSTTFAPFGAVNVKREEAIVLL